VTTTSSLDPTGSSSHDRDGAVSPISAIPFCRVGRGRRSSSGHPGAIPGPSRAHEPGPRAVRGPIDAPGERGTTGRRGVLGGKICRIIRKDCGTMERAHSTTRGRIGAGRSHSPNPPSTHQAGVGRGHGPGIAHGHGHGRYPGGIPRRRNVPDEGVLQSLS
jgi:hypothetical protein